MPDVKPRRAPHSRGHRESAPRAAVPRAASLPEIAAAAAASPEIPAPAPLEVAAEVAAPAPQASAAAAPPEVAPAEVAPAEVAPAEVAPAEVGPAELAAPRAPAGAASLDVGWAAVAAAQEALARGFEEIAGEVTGMTRSDIAATADAAIALLGARTFVEAVEINAGLAGRRVEAMIEGMVKLSEIGVKAVTEASRPILSQVGAG